MDARGVGLEVEHLRVRFGGLQAVDDVTLSVQPGHIDGLIGPNGAGKTTLFNAVSGFVRPESGRIAFDGRTVTRMSSPRRAAIGLARTFQQPGLVRTASVMANLVMAQHAAMRTGVVRGVLGMASEEEKRLVEEAERVLESLAIDAFAGRGVASLPPGLVKLVELAAAVVRRPRLLLLDEPSAGLDAAETSELARHLLQLEVELGFTCLVIDHDMRLVQQLAQNITVLSFGRVLAQGSWSDIRSDHDVIAAYLGDDATEEEVSALAPS